MLRIRIGQLVVQKLDAGAAAVSTTSLGQHSRRFAARSEHLRFFHGRKTLLNGCHETWPAVTGLRNEASAPMDPYFCHWKRGCCRCPLSDQHSKRRHLRGVVPQPVLSQPFSRLTQYQPNSEQKLIRISCSTATMGLQLPRNGSTRGNEDTLWSSKTGSRL